jgi:hypothetical protein
MELKGEHTARLFRKGHAALEVDNFEYLLQ